MIIVVFASFLEMINVFDFYFLLIMMKSFHLLFKQFLFSMFL